MKPIPAAAIEKISLGGASARRPAEGQTARFAEGDTVRARNIRPSGHTRLPRYARGRQGTVHRVQGVFVFPDTNAMGGGEQPQYLYCVRFTARELWGGEASAKDALYLDMWDAYLDPA